MGEEVDVIGYETAVDGKLHFITFFTFLVILFDKRAKFCVIKYYKYTIDIPGKFLRRNKV